GRAPDGDAGRLEALAQRLRHGLPAIADDGEDERHWLTAARVAPRLRRPEHDQRIASRRLLQLKMREGKDQVNHQASSGPVLLRLEPLLLPLAAGARLEQLGAGAEGELERRGGALALAAGAQDVRQALRRDRLAQEVARARRIAVALRPPPSRNTLRIGPGQ